jgi:hypothetical protein
MVVFCRKMFRMAQTLSETIRVLSETTPPMFRTASETTKLSETEIPQRDQALFRMFRMFRFLGRIGESGSAPNATPGRAAALD